MRVVVSMVRLGTLGRLFEAHIHGTFTEIYRNKQNFTWVNDSLTRCLLIIKRSVNLKYANFYWIVNLVLNDPTPHYTLCIFPISGV